MHPQAQVILGSTVVIGDEDRGSVDQTRFHPDVGGLPPMQEKVALMEVMKKLPRRTVDERFKVQQPLAR